MQIIKIPVIIILGILLILIESFLLRVFSFSIFLIIVFSLRGKIGTLSFYSFVILFSIILDAVTHKPLGVNILVLSSLFLLLDFLWLLIPRDGKFRFIPIFLFLFLYYLLLPIFTSLIQDFVFPDFSLFPWIKILVNSCISVGICLLAESFTKYLRSEKSESKIRLS